MWNAEEKIRFGTLMRVVLWAMLLFGAGVAVVQYLGPEKHPDILTPGNYQIALKYHLTEDQVFMDEKPKDCDSTTPPMGDKHCHFEQDLNVVRECLTPNCPAKWVYVSWRKVRD
jgi:hypothetical protein